MSNKNNSKAKYFAVKSASWTHFQKCCQLQVLQTECKTAADRFFTLLSHVSIVLTGPELAQSKNETRSSKNSFKKWS